MLSVPSPHSFFPLSWASRLSLSIFFHAEQQAIFPSSPTWLPGERTGKQNKRITHEETIICTALLTQMLLLKKVTKQQSVNVKQALSPGKARAWEQKPMKLGLKPLMALREAQGKQIPISWLC